MRDTEQAARKIAHTDSAGNMFLPPFSYSLHESETQGERIVAEQY
jgi:hypothetical protein